MSAPRAAAPRPPGNLQGGRGRSTCLAFTPGHRPAARRREDRSPAAGAMSDHFDGRRFFNPGDPERHGLPDLLRWLLTRRQQPWPRWVEDPAPNGKPPAPGPGEVGVTFVNHSTFLLQLGGVNLLTDPIWSERASPLRWAGPRRVRTPGLAFEHLPEVHAVLLSHNHYDHMDLPTLRRLQARFRPLVVTGLGNRAYLAARGVGRVEEIDWWQSLRVAAAVE